MSNLDFSNIDSLTIESYDIARLKIGDNVVWKKEHHFNLDFVDLGITDTSGNHILFATCNLGATSPYDNGMYIAFAETGKEDKYYYNIKLSYTKATTNYYSDGSYTKYNSSENLEAEDDAITQNLGTDYRTPTLSEFTLLKNTSNFTWEWDSSNNGYLVTSKISGYEGNSIFLPASGYRNKATSYSLGEKGFYMTSNAGSGDGFYDLEFSSSASSISMGYRNKYYGVTIRPVKIVSAS